MRTGRVYRIPKEVFEKMLLEHIKGIVFCGMLFDIYRDKETGRVFLKVEGEDGGDMAFMEMKDAEEEVKPNGTPHDRKT